MVGNVWTESVDLDVSVLLDGEEPIAKSTWTMVVPTIPARMEAGAGIGSEATSASVHLNGAAALAKLTWQMDANLIHAAMARSVPTPRTASDTNVPARMDLLAPAARFLLPHSGRRERRRPSHQR